MQQPEMEMVPLGRLGRHKFSKAPLFLMNYYRVLMNSRVSTDLLDRLDGFSSSLRVIFIRHLGVVCKERGDNALYQYKNLVISSLTFVIQDSQYSGKKCIYCLSFMEMCFVHGSVHAVRKVTCECTYDVPQAYSPTYTNVVDELLFF